MAQNIDNRPEWRVTRAGLAYVFGLHPAAVADLEQRGVLVFESDEHIDLAEAAAKIFAEGRLLQIGALQKCSAIAGLSSELANRMNRMWEEMSKEKPSKDDLLRVVSETMRQTQRIIDDMAAVMLVPIGTPGPVEHEESLQCGLN